MNLTKNNSRRKKRGQEKKQSSVFTYKALHQKIACKKALIWYIHHTKYLLDYVCYQLKFFLCLVAKLSKSTVSICANQKRIDST